MLSTTMSGPWMIDTRPWMENNGTHASILKQIEHIKTLRLNWRPTSPKKLEVPHSWILTNEELHTPFSDIRSRKLVEDKLLIGTFLHCVQDQISLINEEDIQARYSDPECTLVDFHLQTPRFFLSKDWELYQNTSASNVPLRRGTSYTRFHLISLVLFNDSDTLPDQLIGGCLTGAPGCWLLNEPHYSFPFQLPNTIHASPAFALVRNPIIPRTAKGEAALKMLSVSLGHPALVVGARGKPNPNSTQSPPENPIELICSFAQQSLDALVEAWRVRYGLTGSSSMDITIPPWLFTFGVICNAHSITILALIPLFDPSRPDVRYICKTVDDIPFGALEEPFSGESDNIQSRIMERIRLLTAMTTISKHAFRLCDIFDAPFIWPPSTDIQIDVALPNDSEDYPLLSDADPDPDVETRTLGEYEAYGGSSWGRETSPSRHVRSVRSDDSNEAQETWDNEANDENDTLKEISEEDSELQRRIESWIDKTAPFKIYTHPP